MAPVHLSIVIPAYNEEKRLPGTLKAIAAYRSSRSFETEVIVVNDGSKDRTREVAEAFAREHPGFRVLSHEDGNRGKGAAVKTGMLAARGAFRLFTDADNSTPIEEADSFFPFFTRQGFDVVIGSRRVEGAQLVVRQPVVREASGRLFSLLVRALVVPGFLDTQCGFKMFTARAAEEIFAMQTIPGFGFDVEIIAHAVKTLGLRVKEAPVRWKDDPMSHVRLGSDSLRMFQEVLAIRRKLRG